MQNDSSYPYYGNPEGQQDGYYPPAQQPYGEGYAYAAEDYGQSAPSEGYYQDQGYYQQPGYGQGAYQTPEYQPQPTYAAPTPEPQPARVTPADFSPVAPVTLTDAYEAADQSYDKGSRRGGAWRIIFFIALLVLVGSVASLGYIAFTYWNGQSQYDELTEYMHVNDGGDGPITLASFDVDWDALRAINSDVVGWVFVPDTDVNYPIVWKYQDDEYYLKHNFGDNTAGDFGAEYGCIMLSGYNNPDWTDQVNIIFGHHLRNGTMFAQLAQFYENSEAFNAHRTYYVLTPQGNFKLTSFACDKVPGNSKDIVIPNFETEMGLVRYIDARIEGSSVVPDPPAEDSADMKQVFAFSTCSEPDNNNRIINFCYVEEFLPAGSSIPRDSSIVDPEDVASVTDQMDQRLS